MFLIHDHGRDFGFGDELAVDPTSTSHVIFFMSIDNCKFRKPVVPGDQLAIAIDEAVPDAVNIVRGAIAAAEYYKKLNREFAPPGTVGFNWNEAQTSFSQGKIGMWIDGIGFAPPLEDPTKSRIVGNGRRNFVDERYIARILDNQVDTDFQAALRRSIAMLAG